MVSNGILAGTREHGRELASMSKNGTTWNFTYDANDMRTARSDGSTAYTYVYNGSQLSQMTVAGNTLNFTYDASGSPLSVSYGGATYYYVTNLQGDVVAILNSSGTSVVTYTYDAWGKLLTTSGSMASTLGVHNPLRYRDYVYDTDTELYYLQSRYYDPEMGRFLNADAFASTGQGILGNNMFAYCLNNPTNYTDHSGLFAFELGVVATSLFVSTFIVVGSAIAAYCLTNAIVLLGELVADTLYNPFPTLDAVVAEEQIEAEIYEYNPHSKNKSKSNKNKHEQGDARRQRDQGGEKRSKERAGTQILIKEE